MGDTIQVNVRRFEGDEEIEADVTITPRMLDVLRLIGRDGLTYKAAAMQLANNQVRMREGAPPPNLSHHTVRRYANDIRELVGLGHLSPMRAMWVFYHDHEDVLEEGSE